MTHRLFLAILLSLPYLALTGCGNSSASNPEASAEPLSAAEVAAAEADMKRVNDEERAHHEQTNPSKKVGQSR